MFYLAKVRGIESQYNGPDMALGMKGMYNLRAMAGVCLNILCHV